MHRVMQMVMTRRLMRMKMMMGYHLTRKMRMVNVMKWVRQGPSQCSQLRPS